MKTYEASLKDKRDWKNAIDTAIKEGRKEGIIITAERLLKRECPFMR